MATVSRAHWPTIRDISGDTKEPASAKSAQALQLHPQLSRPAILPRQALAPQSRSSWPEMNMFLRPLHDHGDQTAWCRPTTIRSSCSSRTIPLCRSAGSSSIATHLSADGVLLVLSSETSDLQHLDLLHECGNPRSCSSIARSRRPSTPRSRSTTKEGRPRSGQLSHRATDIPGASASSAISGSASATCRLKGFQRRRARRAPHPRSTKARSFASRFSASSRNSSKRALLPRIPT